MKPAPLLGSNASTTLKRTLKRSPCWQAKSESPAQSPVRNRPTRLCPGEGPPSPRDPSRPRRWSGAPICGNGVEKPPRAFGRPVREKDP